MDSTSGTIVSARDGSNHTMNGRDRSEGPLNFNLASRRLLPRGEIVAAIVLAATFVGINLVTSSRSPVVWQDEVMFADPAVNLATGLGFTTSAWFQPRSTLFAGNSPLYSLVLAPWVVVFGVGAVALRSLNYVLILAAVGLINLALTRLNLVKTGRQRLLLSALILCADGVTYSYRSGRYDCLGMDLTSVLFWGLTLPRPRARLITLIAVSALLPWAGLQLIPFTAIASALLLLVRGRSALREVVSIAAGGAFGSAALVGFFKVQGVWPEFLRSVTLLGGARRSLASRAADALRAPITEPSGLLLLIALALLFAFEIRRGRPRLRSPLTLGLIAGLVIPCGLAFLGKYMRYYAWMSTIPMSACLAVSLGGESVSRKGRLIVAPVLLLACLVGLPARLMVTALEWSLRDPNPVDRLILGQIRPDDWVFTEYEAYYPAKRSAKTVILPPYIGDTSGLGNIAPPITTSERDRVNVLIVKPETSAARFAFFGGFWKLVGQYAADPSARVQFLAKSGSGSKPYNLIIYRRSVP